jgi:hypothetical protein
MLIDIIGFLSHARTARHGKIHIHVAAAQYSFLERHTGYTTERAGIRCKYGVDGVRSTLRI